MADQSLYRGLVRIHILHHAADGPIFGLAMIRELERHGYSIGPGTLYPVLHGLEKRGYLVSGAAEGPGRFRREYRITPRGRRALSIARSRVAELFHEVAQASEGRAARRRRSR